MLLNFALYIMYNRASYMIITNTIITYQDLNYFGTCISYVLAIVPVICELCMYGTYTTIHATKRIEISLLCYCLATILISI